MEVSPMAVILVHMDSKGDRLLFRYPYQEHNGNIITKTVPEGKKRNPYAANGTSELQTHQPLSNSLCANTKCVITGSKVSTGVSSHNNFAKDSSEANLCCRQLQGCADEVLSTLLAVKQQLCNQKFELKVNDVRFISHPTLIQRKDQQRQCTSTANWSSIAHPSTTASNVAAQPFHSGKANNAVGNGATLSNPVAIGVAVTSTTSKPLPQQMLINIVFALHAHASYSIVKCYHELSKRLGLALKVEEQRIAYLSNETMQMARMHDEISTQQMPVEKALDLISGRCSLAQAIKAVYHDLCTTGLLSTTLNQNLTLSFCLPQKAHQLHKKGSMVDPETIDRCLHSLKPYHGMLLLVDFVELLDCVPPTGQRMLEPLIEFYTPLKSLQSMASDADLKLEYVYKLVSHLVYWAKATIIYPLCETNVYVIAPDANLYTKSHLVEKFSTRFAGMSLFEVIVDFSLPTSIGHLTTPLQQPARQGILAQMVLWMLQHHLLMQLHTYVQFMPSDLREFDQNICLMETSIASRNQQIHETTINGTTTTTNSDEIMESQEGVLNDVSDMDEPNSMICINNIDISDDELNVSSILSMSSQPVPVPHTSRHSISEDHYSAGGSTASDNIAAQPSSSHKSNFSITASLSTENCDSIASIEDEEKIKELLQIFDDVGLAAIRRIPASTQVDDLSLMVKLYQAGYFKSEHHLEEIMYFENLRRSQLLQLLDKFRDVLIIYETEDPAIASIYNNK